MSKNLQKRYALNGYYQLEFRGVTTQADKDLLSYVHALFQKHEDAANWQDIRSFDDDVKQLVPPGYTSGGGAHHIWIHASDEDGHVIRHSFKIKISHDVQGFYKHVAGKQQQQ